MKYFILLTAVVAMLFASCEKYDHAISDIEDRLDKIEGTSLTTIDQQITAINGSVETLHAVDVELKGYIENLENAVGDLQRQIDDVNTALAALEGELEDRITASEQKVLSELNSVKTALESQFATINNTIATLQAKDAELDQKIIDLQTYIDNEIIATEDWTTATFSTLEQYEATQTVISEINALIKSTQESITALEEKLGKKIADDIATAIAGVDADIAAKVTEITDAYTAAIATAKEDITAAYTDAIKTAITASETSMKEWVNGVLADGYYTKAEIDGKITALQTKVAEGDAALQKEIDALKAALAKAESDLTAAYKKAIADAITENNGKITEQIAAAVETAQNNLQAQINTINSDIEKIEARLAIIEADINSINQQIDAINGSIDDLKRVDGELKGYIDSLQNTANDLQSKIDATNDALAALESDLEGQITASEQKVLSELNTVKTALESQFATINNTIATLQAKDAELDQKIIDLQTYIDNEIIATEDWTTATFATLQMYLETQQTIAGIKTDCNAAIKAAVDGLETRMIDWVNGELAQPLKDIAALQADLNALTKDVATDQELADAVAAQQTALEHAKNALIADYEAAITKAIDDNKGVIDAAIAAAITAAANDLQTEITGIKSEINSIKSRLESLENSFANRIQSLKYLPEYNDGKATMDYVTRTLNLDFIISPAPLATSLKQQFDTDNGVIKAYVRYTRTRAAGDIVEQKVSAMSVGENGLFTLTIEEQNLSDEFWTGTLDAVIYVQIIDQDGNNVVSDIIPMVADGFITQLAMPANIRTEQISRGVMRVSWDPVPNADYYEFYKGNLSYNPYLKIDNCYCDIEFTEDDEYTTQDFGIRAASKSPLYTTSEPYESSFVYPESMALTIEYEATEQLTLNEGVFGDGVSYTHIFADGKGTITFDSSVASYSIAGRAFENLTSLESMTFSEGLTSIGARAFNSCSKLKKIVIKGNVDTIGAQAFAFCISFVTLEYYGITEPTSTQGQLEDPFLGMPSPPRVSVTDAYPSDTFCYEPVEKVL